MLPRLQERVRAGRGWYTVAFLQNSPLTMPLDNSQWREQLRLALQKKDGHALDEALGVHTSNPDLYSSTPLTSAVQFGSAWGVEQILERGHCPTMRALGTFFDEGLASAGRPASTLVGMWNAWLPWLGQQDHAFRSRALALFVDRARPCEVNSQGKMQVLFPLARAITWDSLSVSQWGQGCWESVVSDVIMDTPDGEQAPAALSPLQRAWLGDGHALVERLLKEGASLHRVHPTSALPHWSLASLWEFLDTAHGEGWTQEQLRQAPCPALKGSALGEAFFREAEGALLANFKYPGLWRGVRAILKEDALEQALPAPLNRPSPKPRF